MKTFIYTERVYLSDTDAQGIAYHASYLNFAEHARSEVARECGSGAISGENGFVVKSLTIDYRKPALLDEVVTVESSVSELGAVSLVFHQVVKNPAGEVCAVLDVKLGFINLKTRQLTRLDKSLVEALTGEGD